MYSQRTIYVLALGLLNGLALPQPPILPPVPPIIVPSKGVVWTVGELRTVEWGIPTGEPLTNSSGAPILGFILLSYESGQPLNPVLLEDYQLASEFPISQKMVNIIVPNVPTRKDYMIFMNAADDGVSWTDPFEIFNPSDPQGTGARPTSISVSSAPPISVTLMLPTSVVNTAPSTPSNTMPPTLVSTARTSSSFGASNPTSSSSAGASQIGTPNSDISSLSRSDLKARMAFAVGPLLLVVHAHAI